MPKAAFSREQICAHRGASGAYPENTHAAFDAAASVGAGWIETDIQCLADGELVIFHDTHLGRTAPGSAKVTSLSWPDMAELDVGSWKGSAFASERPLRCEDLIAWQAEALDRPGIVWEVKCEDDSRSSCGRGGSGDPAPPGCRRSSLHCVELQSRCLGCPQAPVTRNSYGADCRGAARRRRRLLSGA